MVSCEIQKKLNRIYERAKPKILKEEGIHLNKTDLELNFFVIFILFGLMAFG